MPEKKVFKPSDNKPINDRLDNLELIKLKVAEIKNEETTIIKQIRNGFVDSVVIFVDLVDSTKFKIENQTEPEKWILRLKQFSDIVKEYIENSNGKVVKYIGDELMGIFDQATQIDDALSLILRIKNIESNLFEITGFQTKVKIALDFGKVFLLKYEGHNELDPQGTPIDRCARIGKYCVPGSVLSSYEFVSKCTFPKQWFKIGNAEMKGLGSQPIYQYGEQTIEIKKKIEIEEELLDRIKDENSKLTEENQGFILDKKEMISTISKLQKQLQDAGEKPIIDTDFSEKAEKEQHEIDYDKILDGIRRIKKLIHESGVSDNEYGRFLFLNEKGYAQEYNTFKNKTFDDSIEKDLVCQNSDERFELNTDNKRNIEVTKLINQTERLLQQYVASYGNFDDSDLFEYSFSDADFWNKYLDIYVL
jgi:class 3 adenylate cyclase